MKLRRMSTATVVVMVIGLTLAACSSSKKSSGAPATTSTPSNAAKVSGTPVEVAINFGLTGAITFPQVNTAIQAASAGINASGGIKGRPLKVDVCDGQSPTDPTPSVQCTRTNAANQAIVAEVGDYTSFGDQITPILHDAGMADIGPVPLAGSQLSLDNSFPLMGSEGGGLGVLLADQGAQNIGLAYIDIPAGSQSISFGDIFLGKGRGGLKYGKTVPIPLSATDVTPQVASLAGSDGVSLSLAPTQVAQFMKAYQQGGYKFKVGAPALAMLPEELKALGGTAEGMYVVSGLPLLSSNNPGVARFKQEMAAIDPNASQDTTSLNAWLAVHAFAQVANTINGDVTRASVLQAWKSLTNLDVLGMLPPGLNLQNSPLGLAPLARLTNVWVQYGQIKGGQITDLSHGWVSLVQKQ